MERRLSEFFTTETAKAAGLIARQGQADPLITGVEYDSRKVKPGVIFCALRGLHTDGHRYINDALAKGAVAVLLEDEAPENSGDTVYLQVKDSRFAMSPLSAAFYGYPCQKMIVIGVTGTEGKSTTVYLIYQLLQMMGHKTGFLSTVLYSTGGEVQQNPEHQTTPEANDVQRLLYEMANNGVKYAVVEASSHGLSSRTNRLGNVDFDAAVFTNITHEHLEFHGTWEQYREDKANLFRALTKERSKVESIAPLVKQPFGVINADDPSAEFIAGVADYRMVSFSAKGIDADLSMQSIQSNAWGNWYVATTTIVNEMLDIRDQLPGAFNAGNVLAALLTVSCLLEIPLRDIVILVTQLKPLRGRMTAIECGQPFEVMVDYAHTPSSFLAVFPPLKRRLSDAGGRIISVFGSAGERDTKKRGEQGKIAADYSDFIVLTDEDPRGEQSMDILNEIAAGFERQFCGYKQQTFNRSENLFLIPDRPAAIRKALSLARAGDIVLLLGKGHENSIIYADRVMPYDEITEAEKALAEMGFPTN